MDSTYESIDINSIMNSIPPLQLPSLNVANTAYEIDRAIEQSRREREEKEQRALNAAETTADNTAQLLSQMNTVTKNQNDHIQLLNAILQQQQQQIALLSEQLQKVKNIFASQEDGVAVEKEIMRLIQEQIDDKHPMWEYVKDKGGDLAISAITPVIYNAVKVYLATQGVILP